MKYDKKWPGSNQGNTHKVGFCRVGLAPPNNHTHERWWGKPHPDMERHFTSKIFHFLLVFSTYFKNALVQATSTMHQSDIRRLVSTKRPEPTLICCVKSCAFYGREYRTNVAAHIGWVAFSSYRAHTKSIIPSFKLQITLSSFSHCLRQQIEAVRKTYSRMDGVLNAAKPSTHLLI